MGEPILKICSGICDWLNRQDFVLDGFLEFIREILKGVVREAAAHVIWKNVLDHKKTTHRRTKQSGPQKTNKPAVEISNPHFTITDHMTEIFLRQVNKNRIQNFWTSFES